MDYSFFAIIDVVTLAVGVYAFYTCYLMKTTGEIKKKLIISEQMDINRCNDKKGFIDFTYPKLIILGVLACMYGVTGLVNSYVTSLGFISLIIMIIFAVYLIWFAKACKKAVKRFWEIK